MFYILKGHKGFHATQKYFKFSEASTVYVSDSFSHMKKRDSVLNSNPCKADS